MNDNMKTIKEIADDIGVSKQAVWQKIKRQTSIDLRKFTSKKGNTVYVSFEGERLIKSMFIYKSSTKKEKQPIVDDNKKINVDEFENEIKFLRNLIIDIQKEKQDLYKIIDQQQQLSLQDKNLIEDYKKELADVKSARDCPSPIEKISQDNVNNYSKKKKWWKFWND